MRMRLLRTQKMMMEKIISMYEDQEPGIRGRNQKPGIRDQRNMQNHQNHQNLQNHLNHQNHQDHKVDLSKLYSVLTDFSLNAD